MMMLERQMEIYAYLKIHKFATVDQLAARFYVGPASIRRDLKKLEEQNAIRRTHGGAVFLEGSHSEVPIAVRQRERAGIKERIGRLAAAQIREGDIVFLDSSTTALAMVPHLRERTVTVLTNSLKVCGGLSDAPKAQVYLCGGRLRNHEQSVAGPLAVRLLQEFRVQKVFFSCRAMSEDGELWDYSEDDAALLRAVLAQGETAYFLCDSAKVGGASLHRVCHCRELDYLLSEQRLPAGPTELLRENQVILLTAE